MCDFCAEETPFCSTLRHCSQLINQVQRQLHLSRRVSVSSVKKVVWNTVLGWTVIELRLTPGRRSFVLLPSWFASPVMVAFTGRPLPYVAIPAIFQLLNIVPSHS